MHFQQAVACGILWISTQALWLSTAYKLEFLGEEVFFSIWIAGLVYVFGHVWVLGCVINAYEPSVLT
jgi:GPI mannosyltransferase 1 subunit M